LQNQRETFAVFRFFSFFTNPKYFVILFLKKFAVKNLDAYISELLFRHDMVVMPDFGAFIGRRKPAEVDKKRGLFLPPSKEISFNGLIRNNDGLLIHYIARKEGIPYNDAARFVQEQTAEWKNRLQRNHVLHLKDIGFFHIEDGKLNFTPYTHRNYLAEAYGLNLFFRQPAGKKHTARLIREVNTQEEMQIPASAPLSAGAALSAPDRVHRRPGAYEWMRHAAAAVIFLIFLWGGLQAGRNNTASANHSDMQHATYVLPHSLPTLSLTPPQQPVKNSVSAADSRTFYYIIIGAFKNKQNAVKLMERLRADGINASTPANPEKGLFYVAYETFTDAAKAEKKLPAVRKKYPDAWIWSRTF